MLYFKVRNFEQFQHYQHRNPPWIKLYYNLLHDRRFFRLDNSTKFQIIGIFLLASQHENKLPMDEAWIEKELSSDQPINWQSILESEFIEPIDCDASTLLATCTKIVLRVETEKSREETEILSFSESEKEFGQQKPSVRQFTKESHEIFHHWNSKSATMKHRAIDGQEKAIIKALRRYSPEEVKRAIGRYSQVRENVGGRYRDLYAWTLGEFLTRHNGYNLERFNAESWEDPFLANGNHKPDPWAKYDTIGSAPESETDHWDDLAKYNTPEQIEKLKRKIAKG